MTFTVRSSENRKSRSLVLIKIARGEKSKWEILLK